MVVCAKQRVGDKRIIVINEGVQNIQDGTRCIIVDDMVQSGSTIIECAKELHRHGDLTVNAFCTHGVFPGESWRKFEKQIVNTFYVTNSLPRNNDNYFQHEHPQESTTFKVLSVEPIVSLFCLDTKRTRNKEIAELYES
jgi:phosphoribosylpyrophosphate synthetase